MGAAASVLPSKAGEREVEPFCSFHTSSQSTAGRGG